MMTINLEQLADQVIETDFLVVGGGLAGCMAAIQARKKGNVDVAIMDKANFKTSGIISLDHYQIQHPLLTGTKVEEVMKGLKSFAGEGFQSPKLNIALVDGYMRSLAVLDEIGVTIHEDDGTYKMIDNHPTPGGPPNPDSIYYRGADLKEKLAAAAEKSGARIFNRTMLTNLLTKDGTVVGAMGVNIRTGQFLVFKAKAVLLSTGGIHRLYPYPYAPFPHNLVVSYQMTMDHGGGVAAAYRAGAKLANMEFIWIFTQSGAKALGNMFYNQMKNSKGEVVAKKYPPVKGKSAFFRHAGAVYSPNMQTPEADMEVFFADSRKLDDDQITQMNFTNASETPEMLKVFAARGETRNAPSMEVRPVTTGLVRGFSGILPANDKCETSIKNLFVAGDLGVGTGGGAPIATAFGYIVGKHVREWAPGYKQPAYDGEQLQQVETEKKRALAPLGRTEGVNPLELEDYIAHINLNYINIRKVEPKLKRAIDIFNLAQEGFVPALGATNPHELMNALEVQDIIELSRLHAQASLLRKESRNAPNHYRLDYPEQDDVNWKKALILQNVGGEMKSTLEKIE